MAEPKESALRMMAVRAFESGQPVKTDQSAEFEEAVLQACENHPDGRTLFAGFIDRSSYEVIGKELNVTATEAIGIFESFLHEVRDELMTKAINENVPLETYWLEPPKDPLAGGSNGSDPVS